MSHSQRPTASSHGNRRMVRPGNNGQNLHTRLPTHKGFLPERLYELLQGKRRIRERRNRPESEHLIFYFANKYANESKKVVDIVIFFGIYIEGSNPSHSAKVLFLP